MIGQLGSVSIAAIGLAGKFISLLAIMVNAIAAVAGIIMAQAIGKRNKEEISRGLYTNLLLALVLALGFTWKQNGLDKKAKDMENVMVVN